MRFLDSARDSFVALGDTPYMGGRVGSQKPAFDQLRKWRVSGFAHYLIFYLPVDGGVDILRILHGAQDWWQTLGIDNES